MHCPRPWAAGLLLLTSLALVLTHGSNAAVAREKPTGAFGWTGVYTPPTAGPFAGGRGNAVAIDPQRNVIAVGYQRLPESQPEPPSQFLVTKWTRHGTLAWTRHLMGDNLTRNEALAVTTDAAGNVIAGGFTTAADGNELFTVAKWSPGGDLVWTRAIDHSPHVPFQGSQDRVWSLAVDAAGNVVAAGESGIFDDSVPLTVKLSGADGEVLWTWPLGDLGARGAAYSVALDGQGNAALAGRTWEGPSGFGVWKLNGATGTRKWSATIDLAGSGGGEQANAVAVDSQGHVVAAGVVIGEGAAFTVGRFDRDTGALLWHTAIYGESFYLNEALAVAVDLNDDVLAAGSIRTPQPAHVVKLAGATGAELWRGSFYGAAAEDTVVFDGIARGVGVDEVGQVTIAGEVWTDMGSPHFFGHDLGAASWTSLGAPLGNRTFNAPPYDSLDEGTALAVDYRGNVAVAGTSEYVGGLFGFTVASVTSSRLERLSVASSRLSFGNIRLGQARTRVLTLRNTGTATLTGRLALDHPAFTLSQSAFTVPPRGSATVEVTFNASYAGRRTADLQITSSDPRAPTARVRLTAAGKP